MNAALRWSCFLILACILTAFGPGGCGEGEDPPTPPSTPDAGLPAAPDAGDRGDAGASDERGDAGRDDNNEGCRTRCAIASRTTYRECLDGGGTEEQCGQRSRRQNAQCIQERCGGDDEEDNGCERRCGFASRTTYNDCIEGGGSAEDCRERARRDNARCIEERCNGGDDEEEHNGCETRCGIASRTTYRECIDGGGTEEQCRQRSRRQHAQCIEERCNGGDDEEEHNGCETRCGIASRTTYRECIDGGGTEEQCRQRSRRQQAQCVEERCGGDNEHDQGGGGNNDNNECTTRCQRAARTQTQRCIDAGRDPDGCRQEARDDLARCLRERCGG